MALKYYNTPYQKEKIFSLVIMMKRTDGLEFNNDLE